MRILGIVGIWDFARPSDRLWSNFKAAFERTLPGAAFEVEHLLYSPWECRKMRDFADRLVKKYDTGGELLIVGYSLGGVIATAIAPRFSKTKMRCVATVCSPHRFLFGFYSRALGSDPAKLGEVPVLSFGALLDFVVPCGSKFPKAAKHARLWSDHLLCFLLSKKPAIKIAEEVTAFILKA